MCLEGETRLESVGMIDGNVWEEVVSQVGGGGGILRCSTSERVQCTMEKFKTCKKVMIKLFIFSIAFIKLHAFSWICLKYYDEK